MPRLPDNSFIGTGPDCVPQHTRVKRSAFRCKFIWLGVSLSIPWICGWSEYEAGSNHSRPAIPRGHRLIANKAVHAAWYNGRGYFQTDRGGAYSRRPVQGSAGLFGGTITVAPKFQIEATWLERLLLTCCSILPAVLCGGRAIRWFRPLATTMTPIVLSQAPLLFWDWQGTEI